MTTHPADTPTVLGIIPARGGSKRIPNKNTADLDGKPLIAYAIQAAKDSKVLDACIVSTDNSSIAETAKSLGADVPFLRPQEYARDDSPDIEYVTHALEWLEQQRGWKPEIIVLLPPDVPIRTGKDIDDVVEFMIQNKFDSVRTVVRPSDPIPYKAMWVLDDKKKRCISPLFPEFVGKPSQTLPEYYISVGVVYATRATFVHQGALWGPHIGGYILETGTRVEIDEPVQLQKASDIFQKKP